MPIKHRQEKIQTKRKTTPRRQFLMEIGSWYFLTLHKRNGHVCRYPDTSRRKNVISREEYKKLGEIPIHQHNGGSFLRNLEDFFFQFPKEDRLFFYGGNENIEYTDGTFGAKNAYLSYEVGMGSENVCYSNIVFDNCKNIFSSQSVTDNCSIIYLSAYVTKSFKVFYSRYIHNSNNIYFSTNLIGCSDCIECHSLENASYCYKNKQLEKHAYLKVKEEILSNTSDFENIYKTVKATQGNCVLATESSGSALFNTQNVNQSHYTSNLKHGRNVVLFQGLENSTNIYDSLHACGPNSHHLYGVTHTGENVEHIYCSTQTGRSNNIYYSFNIESCSYCLGCTGLKNKQFCIFNTQYTKEERHSKVDEIFSQMEKDGTLGNFFPGSMNPFYFNDTAAYLIDDSFTKEEVEATGYLRRDEEIKVDIPEWMDVVEIKDLAEYEGWSSTSSDGQKTITRFQDPTATPLDDDNLQNEKQRRIDPAILKKVIRDEDGNSYRVIKMEYDFLVKHRLPLPRKHRLERLKGHFKISR